MSGILMKSAAAYMQLSTYRYHFILGHKQNSYNLAIEFPETAFWHLAGLHKLRIQELRIRKKAMSTILSGSIPENITTNPEIIDRWKCICNLQELIESNKVVFKYRGHEFKGSTIHAEYLLTDNDIMFFINGGFPVSIFRGNENQHTQSRKCPRLTTLMITREEISSGKFTDIYISPSYKK